MSYDPRQQRWRINLIYVTCADSSLHDRDIAQRVKKCLSARQLGRGRATIEEIVHASSIASRAP